MILHPDLWQPRAWWLHLKLRRSKCLRRLTWQGDVAVYQMGRITIHLDMTTSKMEIN